jgi:DNA-binding SARP family transcriptional activator/predicted ATPase/Flp pilus assembly protein TadD
MENVTCIRLLGPVQVDRSENQLQGFESRKAVALLCYLAARDRPVSRERLIDLFWGKKTEARGRGNLSRVMHNLNTLLPGCIRSDRYNLRFEAQPYLRIDVHQYQNWLASGEPASLLQVVELWRGEFMDGFYLDDCPEFEAWILEKRQHWHELHAQTLLSLVDRHIAAGDLDQALSYTSGLLKLDPWREEAHRKRMQLLARTGQRSAALKQFEVCRRLLAEELGVQPERETRDLYEKIHRAREGRKFRLPPLDHLPPLVGREAELADIHRRLASPGCRLLTITGPGGIGKSRLALQVSWELRFVHLDGVVYTPLVAAHSTRQALECIAQAVDFPFQGGDDLARQLNLFLEHKEVLLVLDNVEHLLHLPDDPGPGKDPGLSGKDPGLRGWIAELLDLTPTLKFLVASRERLNLKGEWAFPLGGLSYRRGEAGPDQPPAQALLIERARQLKPGFSVPAGDLDGLDRVCETLAGNPLGIELAACLAAETSCTELAGRIRMDLDSLASAYPNTPERHRSLRQVFDYSWKLLTPREKEIFRSLAVFEGGFRPQVAAAVVEGFTRADAGRLSAKSLIEQRIPGRYEMHDLMRRYALEKLGGDQLESTVRDNHSRYYLGFLAETGRDFQSGRLAEALAQAGEEIENIRLAWSRAVERGFFDKIDEGLETLFQFFDLRGWFQEGLETFEQAAGRLEAYASVDFAEPGDARRATITRLRLRKAVFLHRIGRHREASAMLQEYSQTLAHLGDRQEEGLALYYLGFTCWWLGEYTQAERYIDRSIALAEVVGDLTAQARAMNISGLIAEARGDYAASGEKHRSSLEIFRSTGDALWIAKTLNYLGILAYALGQYELGIAHYLECLQFRRKLDDPRGVGLTLTNLGNSYRALGKFAEAEECHREALQLFRRAGNQSGIAASENNLGNVLRQVGRSDEACRHLLKSLEIKRRLGDLKGCANSLNNLGWIALEEQQSGQARQYFREALAQAQQADALPTGLESALGAAALLSCAGRPEDARAILKFILDQAATGEETRKAARERLDSLPFEAGGEEGQTLSLEDVRAWLEG